MTVDETTYYCSDCWHFHNCPKVPYNKIHEDIKQCKFGNIVHKKVKACHKLARKKTTIRFKRKAPKEEK